MDDIKKLINNLKERGDLKLKQGDFKSAIPCYKKILKLNPDNFTMHFRLGKCLEKLGRYKKAIEHYLEFEKKSPKTEILGDVYNSLGYLYSVLDDYKYVDLQIEYFKKALEINPNNIYSTRNLAFSYYKNGEYEKTVEYLDKFFNLGCKDDIDSNLLYFEANMFLQNFEKAFEYYEYRFFHKTQLIPYPKFKQPKWNGENISDKTLLVQWEQGFGDTLMFVRFLHNIKPLARKIILRVQDELVDLIRLNFEGIEVVGTSDSILDMDFDYQVPLLSLMRILNLKPDNIPLKEGYLKADERKIEKFKKEYFDNNDFKIGIAWCGRPNGIQSRNIPLKCFYKLAKRKNIKLYSFQKGVGSEQLKDLPPNIEIIDLGSKIKNFSDSAAAMANLDLFISSDNGVLNLAGAMGKRAILLLSKLADWRWFNVYNQSMLGLQAPQDGECLESRAELLFRQKCNLVTPWYKSVQIIQKQNEKESWSSLIRFS